jgi:hypothetical protein
MVRRSHRSKVIADSRAESAAWPYRSWAVPAAWLAKPSARVPGIAREAADAFLHFTALNAQLAPSTEVMSVHLSMRFDLRTQPEIDEIRPPLQMSGGAQANIAHAVNAPL